MLHALIHKKSKGRKLFEDEITSCIFGPLRFMAPDMAWRSLLVLFDHPAQLKDVAPTCVDVQLWPQWRRTAEGGRVEPDVYIVARTEEDEVATIIVEVKTVKRSSINRDHIRDQLRKQWESPDFCRTKDHSVHVFLGPDLLDEVGSAIRKGHQHLRIVSWHGLARSLKKPRDRVSDVWHKDVLDFLAALDVIDFDGFKTELLDTVGKIGWQFHNQWEPGLHTVAQLGWSFNQQIQEVQHGRLANNL